MAVDSMLHIKRWRRLHDGIVRTQRIDMRDTKQYRCINDDVDGRVHYGKVYTVYSSVQGASSGHKDQLLVENDDRALVWLDASMFEEVEQ